MSYKLPEYTIKWYHKLKVHILLIDAYYSLKFNLYTVHTYRFKLWNAMHKHINNQL